MAVKNTNAAAAAARARLARRAKRARFWKENKKRVGMIFVGFVIIAFLIFFTPWGPMYFWTKIQETKMADNRHIRPGAVSEMYKLGNFYNSTMRSEEALKCFDEIGLWYFGYKLSDYSRNPTGAEEKRRQALASIRKAQGYGPPFEIAEEDLKYVGLALFDAGGIINKSGAQLGMRIYKDLYLDQFKDKYPQFTDQQVNKEIDNLVLRYEGRR